MNTIYDFLKSLPKHWQVIMIVTTVVLSLLGVCYILDNFHYIISLAIGILFLLGLSFDLTYSFIRQRIYEKYSKMQSKIETLPIVLSNCLQEKSLRLQEYCHISGVKITDITFVKTMLFAKKGSQFNNLTHLNSPFYYYNADWYKTVESLPIFVFQISTDKLDVTNVSEFITCINDIIESYCLSLAVRYYQIGVNLDFEQERRALASPGLYFDEELENVKYDADVFAECKKQNFPIDSNGDIINIVPAIVDIKRTRDRKLNLYVGYTSDTFYNEFTTWYATTKKGAVTNDNF